MELALVNLASLYLNTDRPGDAAPIMRQLIKKYPENQEYRRVLAMILESE